MGEAPILLNGGREMRADRGSIESRRYSPNLGATREPFCCRPGTCNRPESFGFFTEGVDGVRPTVYILDKSRRCSVGRDIVNNIVGKRFGKQVVLKELGGDYVEIKCDCGTVKKSRKQYILNGQSKSCGCGRYAPRGDNEPIEVGHRFERLVVAQLLGTSGRKRQVLTVCDCGNYKVVNEADLRSGTVKSCGCLRRERMENLNRSHGQAGQGKRTALYQAWTAMRERVRHPERWPSYVGRTVFSEWENSFEAFRDYVDANLGPRPTGFSLDRIDNDRNYEPGNLRWASAKTQANNRSGNARRIVIDGVVYEPSSSEDDEK
jgi:hypothetical protein